MTVSLIKRPTTAPRYRGASATYVQAWHCAGMFSGIVYSQSIAIDKLFAGSDVNALTIVRHDDGRREYLMGCIASAVFAHREH